MNPSACRHCGKGLEDHHSYDRICWQQPGEMTFNPGPTYQQLVAERDGLTAELVRRTLLEPCFYRRGAADMRDIARRSADHLGYITMAETIDSLELPDFVRVVADPTEEQPK